MNYAAAVDAFTRRKNAIVICHLGIYAHKLRKHEAKIAEMAVGGVMRQFYTSKEIGETGINVSLIL
jgi:hypothetical protein